jgi:hypothetical protein
MQNTTAQDSVEFCQNCFIRELGPMERLMHLYSSQHPRHFSVAADLIGSVEPKRLIAAFAAVQARHPMLSVCVKDSLPLPPGIYGSSAPIDLELRPLTGETVWTEVVASESARPFSDDRAPLMRAVVLHAPDRFILVLTFHHALADGISAVTIVHDLMKALAGQPLPRLAPLGSRETLAAAQATLQGVPNVPPAAGVDADRLRAIGGSPLWRPFHGDRPQVSTCSLDRDATARLLAVCRAQGTTLNGALCAAVTHSAVRQAPKPTFTIANAVNLRDTVGAGHDSVGLLAGIAAVRLEAPDRQGFWELARQTTREIAPARTLPGALQALGGLTASLPPDADATLASGLFGLYEYDAVVSNLGVLAIPAEIGSLRLDAFWGPAVQGRFKNEIVIGAAGVRGALHLLQTSPDHIANILPGIESELLAAAAGQDA